MDTLSRPSRLCDYAVAFGRSCQSPRTGFVHLFASEPGGDVIPIYENFCFAIALIRQKTAEGVLEGKELLERLYAFQAREGFAWPGNFPIYLHDYPRCWNPLQPLRIAPLLQQLKKHFGHVLGEDFNKKTALVLERLLACAKQRRDEKPYEPLWERRYQALLGNPSPRGNASTSAEWADELINLQLQGDAGDAIAQMIHPALHIYTGPSSHEAHEQDEPKPTLLDWWIGGSSPRLSRLHPMQIELAALSMEKSTIHPCWSGEISGWQIRQTETSALSFANALPAGSDRLALRFIWSGVQLHSLAVPTGASAVQVEEAERGATMFFDLPEIHEITRNDLIETALYCDVSPETDLTIEGKKSTTFQLGESVLIKTPGQTIRLRFSIEEGDGAFFGQISRGNRPFQTACKGAKFYEAFDWKISLRTLRRSPRARLALSMEIETN